MRQAPTLFLAAAVTASVSAADESEATLCEVRSVQNASSGGVATGEYKVRK